MAGKRLNWNDINATEPKREKPYDVTLWNHPFGEPPAQETAPETDTETDTDKNTTGAVDQLLSNYKEMLRQEQEMNKRRNSRAIVNGIADMGRALANLFFTSKGAPNAYDPSQTVTASAQGVYDKQKADRDKQRAEWLSYMMTRKKLKDNADELAYKREVLEDTKKRTGIMEQAEERRRYKDELDDKYHTNKLDLDREKAEVDREYKEGMLSIYQYRARIQAINAKTSEINANTAANKEDRMSQGTTKKTTRTKKNPITGQDETTVEQTTIRVNKKPTGVNWNE